MFELTTDLGDTPTYRRVSASGGPGPGVWGRSAPKKRFLAGCGLLNRYTFTLLLGFLVDGRNRATSLQQIPRIIPAPTAPTAPTAPHRPAHHTGAGISWAGDRCVTQAAARPAGCAGAHARGRWPGRADTARRRCECQRGTRDTAGALRSPAARVP